MEEEEEEEDPETEDVPAVVCETITIPYFALLDECTDVFYKEDGDPHVFGEIWSVLSQKVRLGIRKMRERVNDNFEFWGDNTEGFNFKHSKRDSGTLILHEGDAISVKAWAFQTIRNGKLFAVVTTNGSDQGATSGGIEIRTDDKLLLDSLAKNIESRKNIVEWVTNGIFTCDESIDSFDISGKQISTRDKQFANERRNFMNFLVPNMK